MMSKSSPIYISDDSEDEKDESSNNYAVVEVSSDDENKMMPRTHLSPSSTPVKVKTEPETIPTKTSLELSPNAKIILNKKRLKWLSGVIKLPGVPVKTESEPSDQDHLEDESSSACTSKTVKQTSKMNDPEDNLPQTLSSSTPTDESEEDHKDHEQAPQHEEKKILPSSPSPYLPLSYKHFPESHFKSPNKPKNSKSNLRKKIQSPRKVSVFGSPQKSLKQSLISEESFSPKKLMENPSDKIEDTSDHTQPLHACPMNGYVPRLKTTALTFSESQLNILEAIKEEGLVAKYIDTIMSFLSIDRKPPSQLCYDLMREVLLKSENSYLVSKSFWALKRIQALHPFVPEQIEKNLLTWDLIEMIVERMELFFGCKCKKVVDPHEQPCVKSVGAAKTLTFLINVMESEVPRKQFCLRRTMAFRLLSLQRQSSRNVIQVVLWLRECIATMCCKIEDCSADYKLFDTISSDAIIHSKKKQLFYALGLFQRLIQLSLSVSEDPEKCACKLAGELLFTYNQIECLEGRSIFLQSFHSHLLRSKFLELYLNVYCADTEADRNTAEYSGIQRIIQIDFERLPQKRDVTESNSEARICHGWHRSQQDCEEMIMVLSYSLQSYLFCHHKKLQCSPKRVPSTSHAGKEEEEEESDQESFSNRRHLSVNDVDQLCNMGDHVIILAGRLMSLCHEASLNTRTNQLLNLLSEMKLWEPW